MPPHSPDPIELELGVTRGTEWLARAVFRPPALVTIGTNAMAVVSFPLAELPDYHELIRLHMDSGTLLFDKTMSLELRLREGLQTTEQIIANGLAAPAAHGWRLPLVAGSKGAVRLGEVALLFKVRTRRDVPLRAVRKADPTPCGTCGASMPWALTGFGALSPCAACSTLNEVQVDTGAPEDRRTTFAPIIKKKSADLPSYDAIAVRRKADLPTFDAISVSKSADLPTFDAIAVLREDPAQRVDGEELSAPTRRMEPATDLESGALAPGAPPARAPHFGRAAGADLPTFDAISVFREEVGSTQGAIAVMRGDEPEAPSDALSEASPGRLLLGSAAAPRAELPPVKNTFETAPMKRSLAPMDGGAPPDLIVTDLAPPIYPTELVTIPRETLSMAESAPVLAELLPEERDFFGEEFSVGLAEQRSFVSVPVLRAHREELDLPALHAPEMPNYTPPPASSGVPAGATPPPHGLGADPIAAAGKVHGRPSGFLRSEAPPRPVLPPLDEDDPGDEGDDFLMGRSDLPAAGGSANRYLLLIGAIAGLTGLALIAYKLIVG